jgi:pimeloyl-ACP methyl ester carboxylesterase
VDEQVRDGRVIRYVESGDGPGMVLVHGWCSDHRSFAPQLEHFARTHRVVALDLRGHSKSDTADSYTIEDFAGDVSWLAQTLELDRPVVVGHSMGGMVAVEAAASAPGVFVAAVALDAPLVDDPVLAAGIDLQMEIFGGPRRDVEGPGFIRAALFGPHDDQARATEIVDHMMQVPAAVGVPALASVKAWPSRRRLLDCVQPILCVHLRGGGPTDPTPLVAERADVMVGQTVGSGHFIQLEVPDQVHAMMERFLAVTRVHA